MATMQSLLDRTRLELGDQPKTFRQEWYGDGVTNRWELDYSPLDADSVIVTVDGVNVSNDCEVEEAAGSRKRGTHAYLIDSDQKRKSRLQCTLVEHSMRSLHNYVFRV